MSTDFAKFWQLLSNRRQFAVNMAFSAEDRMKIYPNLKGLELKS